MANLATNYSQAGRLTEAVPLMEEALERTRKLNPMPVELAWLPSSMVVLYEEARQFAKAEPLYREMLDQARHQFVPDDTRTASALLKLGLNLVQHHKYTDGEQVLRQALTIGQKMEPNAWETFYNRALLGAALLGQAKYDEAEPLLRQGYEGMKQRGASLPPKDKEGLTATLERLVQLYEATGRKDEADQWRQTLRAHKERAGK